VLLIAVTVFAYHQYRQAEERHRREAMARLYRTYAEEIFDVMKQQKYYDLQNRFVPEARREIALDEIAMFVTVLHLERSRRTRWKSLREQDGNISLGGEVELDDNVSYPMEIMIVRRKGQILLRGMRVGNRTLRMNSPHFPLWGDSAEDENGTRKAGFAPGVPVVGDAMGTEKGEKR